MNENERKFKIEKHSVIFQRHGTVMFAAENDLGQQAIQESLEDLELAIVGEDFPREVLSEIDEIHANKKTLTSPAGDPISRAEAGRPRFGTTLIEGRLSLTQDQKISRAKELIKEGGSLVQIEA